VETLFIATVRFNPSDGSRWQSYYEWANIPQLAEVVSLDSMLCPRLITEIRDEDWNHIVCANFRTAYFLDLEYLKRKVQGISRRNILGLYRNPDLHVMDPPSPEDFRFVGYDLIEEQTQISALTNCGGSPDVFSNDELNSVGLIEDFHRGHEVQRLLAQQYPEEPHAQCELYAVWRLNETGPGTTADGGGM
jgi:hypothetical protein